METPRLRSLSIPLRQMAQPGTQFFQQAGDIHFQDEGTRELTVEV